MTIVFVSTGPWGAGQGAPLTAAQHDGNVYDHETRIVAIEAIPPGVGIDDITSVGNVIIFHLSDDTTREIPIELPVFNYRGPWLNNEAYDYPDLVTVANVGVFLVMSAHTTPEEPAEFDPDATDETTDANPLYVLMLPAEDLTQVMRWRGEYPAETLLHVWDVFSDATFGTYVVNIEHVSAVTFDPNATDETTDANPLYAQVAPPPYPAVNTITDTLYEITLADVGQYLRFTDASGCDVTFSDDDFPINTEIHFEQADEGSVTFAETTTTTIIPQRVDYDTATPWQGAVITAKCVAASTWKLIGPHGDFITA